MAVFEKKMKSKEVDWKKFEVEMKAFEEKMKSFEPNMKKFEQEMKVFEQKMKLQEKKLERSIERKVDKEMKILNDVTEFLKTLTKYKKEEDKEVIDNPNKGL